MSYFQIIYQSTSLVPFTDDELAALLQHSHTNNRRNDISGLLLYTPDGRFLQVLEGERDTVRALYHERIARDPRHHNCQLLSEGSAAERCFPGWSMGFRTVRAEDLRQLLASVPAGGPALRVPRPHTRPELLALLQEFVASGDVSPARELPW